MEGGAKGRIGDWGEVVTRYPYENVGMDHLLSKEKGLNTENQVNFILVFSHSVLFSFERLCLSYNYNLIYDLFCESDNQIDL